MTKINYTDVRNQFIKEMLMKISEISGKIIPYDKEWKFDTISIIWSKEKDNEFRLWILSQMTPTIMKSLTWMRHFNRKEEIVDSLMFNYWPKVVG
jgi:hypothetical protein